MKGLIDLATELRERAQKRRAETGLTEDVHALALEAVADCAEKAANRDLSQQPHLWN